MSARNLRLHFTDGRVVVEPLTRTARANELAGVDEARQLIAAWLERGYLRLRRDGGYDVLKARPRPDAATIRAMRSAAALEAGTP